MNTGDGDPIDPASAAAADALLAIITGLAGEMHPRQRLAAATLDSSLDRDLAFDSLGRMELMHRCEREFGVTLPDAAIAEAETPRDLLRAVNLARGRRPANSGQAVAPAVAAATAAGGTPMPAAAAPDGLRTLTEVLDWHAHNQGARPHIRFYQDDGAGAAITYGELRDGARRIAAGLAAGGIDHGETVAIMLPTGADYFHCFAGILMAGAIPVPIYPPGRDSQIEEHLGRHAAILDNARVRLLIAAEAAKPFSRRLGAGVPTLGAIVTAAELGDAGAAAAAPLPKVSAGDTAFLQYTSGSTGAPKGVVLSHANLLANIRAMGDAFDVTPDDVFISWLPLYHDMGLIGAWLGSMVHAIPLVIMPPMSFLARPSRWLRAIHQYRGTISGAPNFAYEACLARVTAADIEALDLGSWRIAFNGAEPVNARTLAQFSDRFAAAGFRKSAMMPVYGLAENSVGLTFPVPGREPRIDRIKREMLAKTGRAEPARPGEDAREVPCCGGPLPGHQIRVIDAAGRELPDRHEGRIEFKGPSATSGYFHNAEATAELFNGDWLNPEDLGYTVAGELYVTGRAKDMIIRAGRNIFPAELEAAIGAIDGVRAGNVAVFGSADAATGTERLVVMAEVRRRDDANLARINDAVTALSWTFIGGPPDDVVLAPPRTVPKTSSGKIRRRAAREIYESGMSGAGPLAPFAVALKLRAASIAPWWRRKRREAGALAFGIYTWVVLIGIAIPVWTLVAYSPSPALNWKIVRAATFLLRTLIRIRLTVTGAENLPSAGAPAIIIANHSSYLDGPVLIQALRRRLTFVAKGELTRSFVARRFLTGLGARFVERFDLALGMSDAEDAARAVALDAPVVYFPEGTFTRMAGLLPFRMGAFTAAQETGAPIIPVVIRGTRAMLRGGAALVRPGSVTVTIGPAITPTPRQPGDPEGDWSAALGLRDAARRWMLENSGEPDLAHERRALADEIEMKAPGD